MLFQFARGVIDQDRDLAIGAPSKTPAEITVTLNKEINAGLADPKVKGRPIDLGATVLAGSSAGPRYSLPKKQRSGAR